MTMTLVSTVTVGSGGAASIDFTSIPQTGTDLLVVCSLRNLTSTAAAAQITLNADTTDANYTVIYLDGNGSAATTASTTGRYFLMGASNAYTASTFGNSAAYIPNYTSSVAKSISSDGVSENNAAAGALRIWAGKWSGTAAITSLSITIGANTIAQYSTASLYTITKGSGGATVS